MKMRREQEPFSTDSLLVELVGVLETHGINQKTYTLHEYVDVDALTEILASGDDSLEIRITIEGIRLGISRGGVCVLD